MTKPIPDKAEVALEYPDKLYIGTFERTALRRPPRRDRNFAEPASPGRGGHAEVRPHAFPLCIVCGNPQ